MVPSARAMAGGETIDVIEPPTAPDEVAFSDDDGDHIVFTMSVDGAAVVFSVNGAPRPPFRQLTWSPACGMPGVGMPDIGKGFPIPRARAGEILGSLKRLAKSAGIACDFGATVHMPADDFGYGADPYGAAMAGADTYAADLLAGDPAADYAEYADYADDPYGADAYGGYDYGAYGGGGGGGGAEPPAKPPAKLSKKLIYTKKRSELTTVDTPLDVPEQPPPDDTIRFDDDEEEDVTIYPKGPGKLAYGVDGKERGVFGRVKYVPQMGLPAIEFPDTGRGIIMQAGDQGMLARVLGGIRALAAKDPKFDCRIPARVMVPPEIDFGLENETADALVADAAER